MEPDAEHQEHHADLGELSCDLHVGHEAGREGPEDHAREQIADQCRQSEADREKTQNERQSESRGDGVDQ